MGLLQIEAIEGQGRHRDPGVQGAVRAQRSLGDPRPCAFVIKDGNVRALMPVPGASRRWLVPEERKAPWLRRSLAIR